MSMKVWRIAAFAGWPASLAGFALFMTLLGPSSAVAQVPWPTPPPAPLGAFPVVNAISRIVPVPRTPGSIVAPVDPIFAGSVPRVPPRPSVVIVTEEAEALSRITLAVDAGATDRTLQFSYEPLSADQVPAARPDQRIQRAFRLQTYDHTATVLERPFRYPVRVSLLVSDPELSAAGNDPARLYLAHFDPQLNRWIPLVTAFRFQDSTLIVRIMQPGLFALVAQPAPVSG